MDPWGREYLYLSPGEYGEVDIYSLGADGLPGGEDQSADIGNWGEDDNSNSQWVTGPHRCVDIRRVSASSRCWQWCSSLSFSLRWSV